MKSISKLRGEEALDVLADILEPASEIMTDKEFVELWRRNKYIKAVSKAIKNHKKAVMLVLAIMDGEDPETYEPPFVSIPVKLLEILNDPDVATVFSVQGQKQEENASGSATESTEETGTK